MKTAGLVSLVVLTGLLLVTTIHAAPSCCDPAQGQAQTGTFSPTPQAGSTFPVVPRTTYTQQVPQTARELGPVPKNPKVSQPSMTYNPAPVVPIQTITVLPQANPVTGSGACGFGACNKTANYQGSNGSCCGGNASYNPRQTVQPVGSLPSCCSGKSQAAAPVPGCCAGQMKPAASAPNCCAVGPKTAAPAPNCCAVGPKTAAALQVPKATGKVASSRLPLQARSAAVRADVPSNMLSAMKITSNGAPVLRFGSLW